MRPHARFRYRDNLWTGADLLPLGMSSFGHLGGVHLQNDKEIEPYMARVAAGELPLQRGYVLDAEDRLVRELCLQLKLGRVRHGYFREKFGVELRTRFAGPLAGLVEAGLATVDEEGVTLTREALLRVDGLLPLLPAFYLPRHRT